MSEDFAALLRELKERSGLSYGTLAKRLHMSTSTLHRYCNGDAVPADYAPVERLARACKASPEELVELHRRWVLADAARRRKAAPAEVRQPERPADAERTASAEQPVSGEQPTSAELPASVVDPVRVGEPARAEEPEPPSGEEPSRPSAERPRSRRRTALLAGVSVAAVLGAVVLAVSLPAGDADDGRGRSVGAASSADGGARVSAEPSGTASPSASRSAGEKDGREKEDKPAASGGSSPSASAGAGAGAAPVQGDEPASGVPLTVVTRPYAWEDPCSQHYLIDSPPDAVHPPPTEQDAPAWVAAERAVSSGEQYVTLTVQGTGAETVVLDSLKVRVVGRGAPLPWNDYAMGVGCGGSVPKRPFTIALDAARPTVEAVAGGRDFPLKVSESDPEAIHITADASAYDVRWYLELAWSSGSRSGTLRIDDEGKPFRTSGNNGRPAYDFPLGGSGWGEAAVGSGE
ncbi:helix-turn-helix domain-containing protein [Streptomyces sp. NPDC003362]